MTNYDLHNLLSPLEFEDLARDLIQAERGITFESFKPGKDLGIDGRFILDKDFEIILQCKQYATLKSLLPTLKKEAEKMNARKGKLNYLLATSLSLSPPQKTKIAQALTPLIRVESQIYGREDLNNLIAKNKDIEQRWPKLWLQNGDALNRVVNLDLVNRNRFFFKKANRFAATYAYDYNYWKTWGPLIKERGLIITGDPGVGKSALAYMLATELSGCGYEPKVVGDEVKDALRQLLTEKKQVFIYDDFLGENIMDKRLRPGEQDDIIELLETARENPSTIVLLISRNYLLNEARTEYERLNRYLRQRESAIIDIAHHSNFDRADIVYQHLYAARLPSPNLDNFIKSELYLPIIRHKNFNPRIVEAIFKTNVLESLDSTQIKKQIESFLDKPYSVWEYPFRNGINDIARDTLLVLLTFNGRVDYPLLFKAVVSYRTESLAEPAFRDSLNSLNNVFIDQVSVADLTTVQFINPSIRDFLVHFVEQNKFLLSNLINSAAYYSQLNTIYVYSDFSKMPFGDTTRMVVIPKELRPAYESKLIELYGLPVTGLDGLFGAETLPDDNEGQLIQALRAMSHTVGRQANKTKSHVRKELTAIINRKLYTNYDRSALSSLIRLISDFDQHPDDEIDDTIIPIISFMELAKIILPAVKNYEHRDITEELKAFYPVKYYEEFLRSSLADKYAVRLGEILVKETEQNPVKRLSFDLRLIEGWLGVELDDIHERILEYNNKIQEEDFAYDPYEAIGMGHDDLMAHDEARQLRDKFSTLLQSGKSL